MEESESNDEGDGKPSVPLPKAHCHPRHGLGGVGVSDYFSNSASFLKSQASTDKMWLDILVKHEEREATDQEARLALERRREEREVVALQDYKELEEKKLKISLAQALVTCSDPELQAAAKKSLLDTLQK